MIRINIGGTWFNLGDQIPSTYLGQQESNVLRLIDQWQNGSTSFSFQTSGSTGPPRQIVFHRDQLAASAQLTATAFQLKSGYTALVCLDVNFVAGAMMVVRCLVTQMNMIIRPPSSDPLDGLHEPIDFAAFVPQQVQTLLDQKTTAQLDTMRTVIIGGAPISNDTIEKLQLRKAAFYATYGMTETLTHVAILKLNGPDRQREFHLLPGIKISIDGRGCLVLHAPHLGPDPIITNDLVEISSENTFRLRGRKDHVINSGGIKIQLQKVEEAVQEVFDETGIKNRFFASGIPDEKLGERLVLVIEGSPLSHNQEQIIIRGVAPALTQFETPRSLLYAPHFSLTPTRKIDRIATLASLQ